MAKLKSSFVEGNLWVSGNIVCNSIATTSRGTTVSSSMSLSSISTNADFPIILKKSSNTSNESTTALNFDTHLLYNPSTNILKINGSNVITASSLSTTLGSYVTSSSLSTTLGGYVKTTGDQTIAGKKTFSTLPYYNTSSFSSYFVTASGTQTIGGTKSFRAFKFKPSGSTSYITIDEYVQSKVCLAEGTLITMADGSKKNIEDVKAGELIQSYNFKTKEKVTAVCLACELGDIGNHSTYLMFEDRRKLKINWTHDVYSVTKDCWCKTDCELDVGEMLLDEDGKEVMFVGPVDWVTSKGGKKVKFYSLISSNNTYYADGFLLAHSPLAAGRWTYYKESIPEKLLSLLDQYKDETSVNTDLMENEGYIEEHLNYMADIMRRKCKMQCCKNELAKTDYIALKAQEGYELDEHTMQLRAQWREQYNQYEAELAELETKDNALKVKYSEIGEDVLLSPMELRKKYFHISCELGNAHLEDFKDFYRENKEEFFPYIEY